MRLFISRSVFALSLLGLASLSSSAAVVYNEAVNGDLSNSGLSPTVVVLALGSNQILGTTGRGTNNVIDRDYFSFTVPVGFQITSFSVVPGTTVGGASSFIGIQGGPQVTLPTNASTAAGLLGWWHYTSTDTNILPNLAIPSNGSSGFAAIGAGTYSVWIQDFNAGAFNYGFDLTLSPAPEPRYLGALGLAALLSLAVLRARRFRPAAN